MRLFLEIIQVYVAPTFYCLSILYILHVFFPNSRIDPMRNGIGGNWPLPRFFSSLILLIILLGVPVGIFMQGTFLQYGLSLAAFAWLIAPGLGVLGLVALHLWIRGTRIPSGLKGWALGLVACIASLALSCGVGTAYHRWEINAVRTYVERALPVLDGIRTKIGAYPATLPISNLGAPPMLLRDTGSYTSDGREFHFRYFDSGRMLGDEEQFDSTSRSWVYDDD